MDTSDSTLLAEYARSQDQAAFAELVARHADWVYSAALRLVRDTHLAEDVTQAVFLLLAQKAMQIGNRPVNAWLFKVTQYCASNSLRSNRRREHHERAAAMIRRDSLDGDAESVWEELAPQLEKSVDRLGTEDRRALLLRFYQRKSMADVGAELGVTEDTAKKRVGKAVERLRLIVAGKGVQISAVGILTVVLSEKTTQAAPVGLAAHCVPASASTGAAHIAQGVQTMLKISKLKWTVAAVVALMAIPSGIWLGLRAAEPVAPLATPTAASAAVSANTPATHESSPASQTSLSVMEDDAAAVQFCNANTQIIFAFNFQKLDGDAIADMLQGVSQTTSDPSDVARQDQITKEVSSLRKMLTRAFKKYAKAHCRSLYLAGDQAGQIPGRIVVGFIAPIGPGTDISVVDGLMDKHRIPVNSADGRARLYTDKPDIARFVDDLAPDSQWQDALASGEDAAVRVVFRPPVLKFAGPLSKIMGLGELSEPQWSKVSWVSAAIAPPPNISANVVIQCQDTDSAEAVAKLLSEKFAAGPTPALAELLSKAKPTVSGNQVLLTWDKPTTEMLLDIWYQTTIAGKLR